MVIMLTDFEMLDTKMENSNSTDNNVLNSGSEHKLIINQTSPDGNFFFPQYMLSKMFTSAPRRKRNLYRANQYRTNRSLDFDISKKDRLKSPNSSSDDSFDTIKLSRDLSRSAKIMRALSSNQNSLRYENMSIKKSLSFDSTPSPKKKSFDESSSTDSISLDQPSPISNKVLSVDSNSTDTTADSLLIVSSESIDENQNQTPQQNRKLTKISNDRTSTKENANGSSPSTSLLRSNLKERIDSIIFMQESNVFKHSDRSYFSSILANTPNNLTLEFKCHQELRTPRIFDGMMHSTPDNMSATKKSHEKKQCHEEPLFTQQMDLSIENENLHTKTTESSKMYASASCSTSSMNRSQMKNINVKKTLVYDSDDELSDTRSRVFDTQQEIASKEANLSGNESDKVENHKVQDIDSNEYKDDMQHSTHFTNRNNIEEDHSEENIHDEEVRPSLQNGSSSICNVNVTNRDRAASPEPNSSISQSFNRVTTPENHINILRNILTESIKKSHKKVKHENGKALFKARLLQTMETSRTGTSAHDISNDDRCKDIKTDTTCVLSPQNFDRPSTPENINSSRLLLSQFSSIKKSHKKDKHSKRVSGLAKCHKYQEYRKRIDSPLQDNRYERKITSKNLRRNKSFELKESPDVLPKKKRSMNMSLQNNTCKLTYSFKSPSLDKDIDDEFKIYTPIRKRKPSYLLNKNNESAQSTSKEVEIDCSRCMTPVVSDRCFEKPREGSRNSSFEECVKTTKFDTDSRISNDGLTDTVDVENETGRSTPINMSTTELLCNIDSIKKSHKKDKHSHSIYERPIVGKKQSEETRNISANIKKILEKDATSFLKNLYVDNHCAKMGMCGDTRFENVSFEEFDTSPQPSTSRARGSIENTRNIKKSERVNITPPNSLNATNFIKLLHTTSIKKSHKKERDCNAQAKYILMSKEHDLSDDGSIFDEEDKLNFESYDPQDNDNEVMSS